MSSVVASQEENSEPSARERTENFLDKYRRKIHEKTESKVGASSGLSDEWCVDCFRHYDRNEDGFLDVCEFTQMLADIFYISFDSAATVADQLLASLDENEDNLLGQHEMRWQVWLKRMLRPISALLVIDVQNDFIDGTLSLRACPAGQDGATIVPIINNFIDSINFDLIVYSLDWHDDRHISFIDNIHLRTLDSSSVKSTKDVKLYDSVVFSVQAPHRQVLWPRHCVRDTWGAQLHQDLLVAPNSVRVFKGTDTDVDSYSAFFNNNRTSQTKLASILHAHKVTNVYICGIAYDICVLYTALDALQLGFQTHIIDDASKGVNLEDIKKAKKNLTDKGSCIIQSHQILNRLSGKDSDINLGLWMAKTLSKSGC